MVMRTLTTLALMIAPIAATAQDAQNEVSFRFGLGPKLAPGYFGDADLDTGVSPKFSLERVQIGQISRDPGTAAGLGFGGSLRFISGRDADDFEELVGTDTIDPSLEIGGRVKYAAPSFEAFAALRYGAVGHKSFVSEIGGDLIFQPTDNLRLTAGPRVLWGDDDYAATYFGVTEAESIANGALEMFDAGGGIISAGAEIEATYAFNDDWQLVGKVTYDALRDDAADSPITERDEQVSTSIVLTRKITFNF